MPAAAVATLPPIEDFDRIWSRLEAARMLTQEARVEAVHPFPHYLRFGNSGNSRDYQLFGWNHAEGAFTWTDGTEAFLELPMPGPADTAMFLNARIAPLLAAGITRQRVRVFIGDALVAHWDVRGPGHYFALIPAHLLKATQRLRFHLPDAMSPRQIGINEDERQLGLQFYELWINPWNGVSF